MSIEQTHVHELTARQIAAQDVVEKMAAFHTAINASFAPAEHEARIHHEVTLDKETAGRANYKFLEAAVELLPSFTEDGTLKNVDAATALMAYRSTVGATDLSGSRISKPYYVLGQSGRSVLIMTAPGVEAKQTLFKYYKDWSIGETTKDEDMFAEPSKKERRFLTRTRVADTQTYSVAPQQLRMATGSLLGIDKTHMYRAQEQESIPSEMLEKYGVVQHLTTLASAFGKSKEFADLIGNWRDNLPEQKADSEADPTAIKRVAGQLGIAGVVTSEQAPAADKLLNLSK